MKQTDLLTSSKSIILGIGDLKISDTHETFGMLDDVNGIKYMPLSDPKTGSLVTPSDIIVRCGARRGLRITDGKDEIFLVYGSNTVSANAQSMAIGISDWRAFFFVEETFIEKELYLRNGTPGLASRRIVECTSLYDSGGKSKIVYLAPGQRVEQPKMPNNVICFNKEPGVELPSKSEEESFERLMAKVKSLEAAFSKKSLHYLRETRWERK